MSTVPQMLVASQLDRRSSVPCRAGDLAEVTAVQMFENPHDVASATRGALVILTAAASHEATDYKLDMVIRRAATAGAAALVLMAESAELRILTSVAIAERAGMSIVVMQPGGDLADVVQALTAALHEDLEHDIERAAAALAVLGELRGDGAGPGEMIGAVGDRIGRSVHAVPVAPEDPGAIWDEVVIDGQREMTLRVDPPSGDPTVERLILGYLARACEHSLLETRRSSEGPAASRSAVLNELLLGDPEPPDQLLRRARRLGLASDDWYASVSVELDNLSQLFTHDEVACHGAAASLARFALEVVSPHDGTWHRAGLANSILLIRTDHERPSQAQGQSVAAAAQDLLDRFRSDHPHITTFCGVGGSHRGFDGLRLSAAESRSGAARARLAGETLRPYAYYGTGFRRLLLQWYSLEESQQMVARLLAPLASLSEHQHSEALRTLRSYLDHAGAPGKVAEELGLHRNTVAYRIERLFNLLDLDPGDPDHRLMLQLACRAVSP